MLPRFSPKTAPWREVHTVITIHTEFHSHFRELAACHKDSFELERPLVSELAEQVSARYGTKMRALLIDQRIVMVLPRREPDMVAWAHKLGPRFIAYADNGENQVAGVLAKMLNQNVRRSHLIDLNHFTQSQA